MVYCLILGVISFVTNFVQKRIRLRRKKKKIIWVLKVFRLASATSALTIMIVCVPEHVGQMITQAQSGIYTIQSADQSECYYVEINPALFPKEIIGGEIRLSENGGVSGTSGISRPDTVSQSNGTTQPDGVSQSNGTSQSDGVSQSNGTLRPGGVSQPRTGNKIPYNFSVLMIFGEYQFGEYITPKDLLNMRIMYNEYWKNEMYWDMLKQDNKAGMMSMELAQDVEENIKLLEQSAIEVENAVEYDNIETIDGYASFLGHIRESVLKFSCVIGGNDTQGSGIKEADIKYRMGKMLYRPAADLAHITNSEKYYSLCSAYVVLKDAFDHSSLDNTYAINVAYSYLLVCNDIVDVMEPGQSHEMINRVKLAYYQLLERVSETSVDLKYQSYCEEAKEIMKRLEERNVDE